MWVVDVIDFDPEARERTFKVKITADTEPIVPPVVAGTPIRPVVLEGLTVTPYLKEMGTDRRTGQQRVKIAYSLRATGMAAPRQQRSTDTKAA